METDAGGLMTLKWRGDELIREMHEASRAGMDLAKAAGLMEVELGSNQLV